MYDIFDIKKQTILAFSEQPFETFENATNETIKEFNSKLANLESQFDALKIEIENNKDEAPIDALSWTTVDEMFMEYG